MKFCVGWYLRCIFRPYGCRVIAKRVKKCEFTDFFIFFSRLIPRAGPAPRRIVFSPGPKTMRCGAERHVASISFLLRILRIRAGNIASSSAMSRKQCDAVSANDGKHSEGEIDAMWRPAPRRIVFSPGPAQRHVASFSPPGRSSEQQKVICFFSL